MGDKWCIVGDFNPVRTIEEMRGNNNIAIGGRDMGCFNKFIKDLEDIPLVGKKYTWFRSRTHFKSRLDRFIASSEWIQGWSSNTQYMLNKSFLYHCPIVLKNIILIRDINHSRS